MENEINLLETHHSRIGPRKIGSIPNFVAGFRIFARSGFTKLSTSGQYALLRTVIVA
jgi:hypothetical protein